MAEGWPFLLMPSQVTWQHSGASYTGGRNLNGGQQVVRSDAGFWRASWSGPVYGEDRTLAYRAMMAQLEGMAGEIEVPCITSWRPYDKNGRMLSAAAAASVSGRSLFNHAGWALTEPVFMTVRDGALAGVMRLTIRHPEVQGLRPGHYFGIGNRLYIVSRCWQLSYEYAEQVVSELTYGGVALTYGGDQPVAGSGGVVVNGENVEVIEFWPRLREPVTAETPLILGRPVCLMRLSSDDTGALEQSVEGISRPTLEFEEV